MSKEMLKQADDWLKSMSEIASEQKDADTIEHMKERIKVQKWLIEQAERVQELEEELNKHAEIGYQFEGKIHDLTVQNKRYREKIRFAIEESKWGDKDTALDRVIAILNRVLEGDSYD